MRTNNSTKSFFSRTAYYAGLLLLTLLSVTEVRAQTPQYYYTISGTPSNNAFPLNSGTINMVQWLFLPTDFQTAPPSSCLITTIYVKQSNITSLSSTTIASFLVKMGNTSITGLSTGAFNTGLSTVISSSSYTVSVNGQNWTAFPLSTYFFYTGGNMLLEMSCTGNPGFNLAHDYTNANRRLYGAVGGTGTANTGQLLFGFDAVPAACSGTPSAGSVTNPAMSPAAPLCAGNTITLTGSDPNFGTGLTYSWQSGPSATGTFTNVVGGSGAATLTYTTGSVPTTTWYRLGITCTNSSIITYSTPYQVIVGAPQPSAITGSPTSCPGDATTYSVTNVPGSTYTWTLPAGWSGSSTSSSILATPGGTPGTISVTASSSCGTSVPRTYTVVAGSAPAAPASITGNTSVCAGSIQTYSVIPVTGATSYIWTLPSGWTGSSATNTITVTTGSAAATGTLSVKAVNGCGNSNNTSLSVATITSLTSPGVITAKPSATTFCTGALDTFSINPVPGATSYIWTLPATWTGTVSGTSIQAFPGTSGGQIQVTAYAACATSVTSTLAVNVTATVTPSVTIAADSPAICQGVASTFRATAANGGASPTYIWKKNGTVVLGTNNTYTDATLTNGDVLSAILVSNATCRSVDSITSNNLAASITPSVTPGIGINSTPVIKICQGTILNFTTTFTGGGTAPTYQWYQNKVAINGATNSTYNTASVSNGDTITVTMTTSATCAKFPVAASNKVGIIVNNVVSPTITITSTTTQPSPGQPITFTATQSGGGPTPVYQWSLNGVAISGEVAATYTSSTLKDGDRISVSMISYDPCAKPNVVASNEIVLGNPTAIGGVRNNWNGSVNLYPNPTGGHFTIAASWNASNKDGHVSVDVLNVLGQRVYHSELAPDKTQSQSQWHYDVQLSEDIAAGRYVVRLSTADGMSANLPLTLTR